MAMVEVREGLMNDRLGETCGATITTVSIMRSA